MTKPGDELLEARKQRFEKMSDSELCALMGEVLDDALAQFKRLCVLRYASVMPLLMSEAEALYSEPERHCWRIGAGSSAATFLDAFEEYFSRSGFNAVEGRAR